MKEFKKNYDEKIQQLEHNEQEHKDLQKRMADPKSLNYKQAEIDTLRQETHIMLNVISISDEDDDPRDCLNELQEHYSKKKIDVETNIELTNKDKRINSILNKYLETIDSLKNKQEWTIKGETEAETETDSETRIETATGTETKTGIGAKVEQQQKGSSEYKGTTEDIYDHDHSFLDDID